MKTKTILMTALVAATVGVPASAAVPAQSQADAVVQTAYKAAQVNPANAADVFMNAIGQRESWSKAGVYDVFKAVLWGANLNTSFAKDLQSYTQGINQQEPGVKLIAALRQACAKLPNGAFEAVVGQLTSDANGVAGLAEDTAFRHIDQNTNGPVGICNTPRRDPRPHPAPVTPEPISPQN